MRLVCGLLLAHQLLAFAPADPDFLMFTNGEKLIGHLERSTGSSLTFKSEMAGEITVDWKNVKELHTASKFALLKKGTKLGKHEDPAKIPQGTLSMTDQTLRVGSADVPVANSAYIIDETVFQRDVLGRRGVFRDWKGSITLGASVIQATQSNQTFGGAIHLERDVPAESWLDRWSRTVVNVSGAYGFLTQPNTPDVKTAIYHGDFERDEYFTPRLYGFGQMAFDHNYSQGLNFEENFGGGIGWTVIKRAKQELDLKASVDYLKEEFYTSAGNQNLVASTFAASDTRKFTHGIVLTERVSFTPAWNNANAYSALGGLTLTLPLHKRLNITFAGLDNFLNNPAPGSRKNSLQLTSGITYTLP